jgi:hypothetical protein
MINMGSKQDANAVDDLVEHEGRAHPTPSTQAFLIGRARLLDIKVDVVHGAKHAHRLMRQRAGVSVGDKHLTGLKPPRDRADPRNIVIGITAYFDLKLAVAFPAEGGNAAIRAGVSWEIARQ